MHQFQGSERDVVVMDLVESFPSAKPGILMSSNENGSVDRLVNVAVTRARGKLVTIMTSGMQAAPSALASRHTMRQGAARGREVPGTASRGARGIRESRDNYP